MKKIAIWILAVLILWTLPAMAAEIEMPESGIVKLDPDETRIDLDGDGLPETIRLDMVIGESEETYTLRVNDAVAEGYGWCLTGDLYAIRMDERICLAVTEYGMSDDHYSHCYLYKEGTLVSVGGIPALPKNMETDMRGVTAMVRGATLQTWSRPGEFILTRSGYFDSETYEYAEYTPVIVEVPRGYYPVGTVVKMKQDLALQVSPINGNAALTLKSGDMAVLVATDDLEWLYIVTLENTEYGEPYAGWAHITDWYYVDTQAGTLYGGDVFEGMLFAD